jgi:hypothetical protein
MASIRRDPVPLKLLNLPQRDVVAAGYLFSIDGPVEKQGT